VQAFRRHIKQLWRLLIIILDLIRSILQGNISSAKTVIIAAVGVVVAIIIAVVVVVVIVIGDVDGFRGDGGWMDGWGLLFTKGTHSLPGFN
jgi:hypothetical protein